MTGQRAAADRTVAVVTGTRAEYGLLKPAMTAIRGREDLSLSVVATGMHLSPAHGNTVEDIEDDGFAVDRRVHMLVEGDSGTTMAKSLGVGIAGLADALADLAPDLVLVLGDRDEAFAAGVAAAHATVPVAHVHGGDSMDGAIVDDSIRHALTKFAHLHFPVSADSADRIERLGEEPWRISTCGAPGLDAIREGQYATPETVATRYDLDLDQPIVLAVQHPVTTAPAAAGDQLRETLAALDAVDAQVLLVYPNSDAGGRRMIEAIEAHDPDRTRAADASLAADTSPAADASPDTFQAVPNLPREDYLGVLDVADAMVGNSSSGIVEAPSLDLPVVDVGPRQAGRERADNTLEVPHDASAIESALTRCLDDPEVRERARDCTNPYDYGGAGEEIAERLATVEIDDRLLRKQLTY